MLVITQMKVFSFLPRVGRGVGEGKRHLETRLGRGGGNQFLCAPPKDPGCRAQGSSLSPILAKTIYLTWEGQFGVGCWSPDPGLGLYWAPAVTEVQPSPDLGEFSGRQKSCGSIMKCGKKDNGWVLGLHIKQPQDHLWLSLG